MDSEHFSVKWSNLSLFFLSLLVFSIPLIVYLKVIEYESIVSSLNGKSHIFNVFSFFKFIWLVVFSISAIISFKLENRKVEFTKLYWPLIGYAYFLTMSAYFSQYPEMAVFGSVERHDGLLTHFCYLIIFLLAFNLGQKKSAIAVIVGSMILSACIISVIGLMEFSGKDFLFGGFADKWLVSDFVRHNFADFKLCEHKPSEFSNIYITFGNSNYTGSYMALLFSLTFGLLFGLEGKLRLMLFPINLALFANLFLCKSRAGYLGVAVSILFFLIFFRKKILTQKVVFALCSISYLLISFFSGLSFFPANHRLLKPLISETAYWGNFKDLCLSESQAVIKFDLQKLRIENNSGSLEFFDHKEGRIPFSLREIKNDDPKTRVQNGKVQLKTDSDVINPGFSKQLFLFPENRLRGFIVYLWPELNVLQISRGGVAVNLAFDNERFFFLNQLGKKAEFNAAPSLGFEGLESFGSSRGYIWSRTLPLLKCTVFVGYGPDTFVTFFPNDDYQGKLRHLAKGLTLIVTKPHCYFLQIATEGGLVALIFFIIFLGMFFKSSAQIYWRCAFTKNEHFMGFAITLALLSYLVSCLFNDSIIAIAPLFWCLLGLGAAVNRNIDNEAGILVNDSIC